MKNDRTAIMFLQKGLYFITENPSIRFTDKLHPDYVVNTLIDFLQRNKNVSQNTRTELYISEEPLASSLRKGTVKEGFSYVVYNDSSVCVYEDNELIDRIEPSDFDEVYYYSPNKAYKEDNKSESSDDIPCDMDNEKCPSFKDVFMSKLKTIYMLSTEIDRTTELYKNIFKSGNNQGDSIIHQENWYKIQTKMIDDLVKYVRSCTSISINTINDNINYLIYEVNFGTEKDFNFKIDNTKYDCTLNNLYYNLIDDLDIGNMDSFENQMINIIDIPVEILKYKTKIKGE